MSQSGKLLVPVLNLLTGQNQHFRPTWASHCTDSREIRHDQGARGTAWPHKISHQSVHGGGDTVPKISKISTFLVKRRLAGVNPLSDF